MNIRYRLIKQRFQISVFIRLAGGFHTETTADQLHLAEYHFRVLHKIRVHLNSVLIGIKMNPIRLYVYKSVTLLQNKNIRNDLRSRIALKDIVRKPDCSKKLSSLCNILSHRRIFLIHCAFAGHKSHHTTGAKLIQRLRKEIVVNQEFMLIISFIRYFKISKRNIADYSVKEAVRQIHFLKSLRRNRAFLI